MLGSRPIGGRVGAASLSLAEGQGTGVHYRLYFLDIANHIRRALDLECADDQEAIGIAKNGHPERPLELWRGA